MPCSCLPGFFQRRAFAPLALALCAGLCLSAWMSREPRYAGKSLSLWLEDFDSTQSAQERATEAVRQMGIRALPVLIGHLEATDSPLKIKVNSWLERQSVVKVAFSPALRRQRLAIRGCRALGPMARPAIPRLIPFLNGPLAYEAAYCLAVIDPAGIYPLSESREGGGARSDPDLISLAGARVCDSMALRFVRLFGLGEDCRSRPAAAYPLERA